MTATRGLEGVVATTSSVSSIIDDTLTYVGYDIDDLTENASFEEIIYLLWHLRLPNKKELEELKQQLAKEAAVPQEIIEHFKSYSLENVHPMAALRTAISLLGLLDSEVDTMNPKPTTERRSAFRQRCLAWLQHFPEFARVLSLLNREKITVLRRIFSTH